ncbi:MAG: hypothetical protein FWH43_05400 [Endomicrobia bacterium]|nr:hypothetical protein [Endomicrobiia bacterium]
MDRFIAEQRDILYFQAQIGAYFSGTLKYDDIKISVVPFIFKYFNIIGQSLRISVEVLEKIRNGHSAAVPFNVIDSLPQLLADPVIIMKSITHQESLVVVLNAKDANLNTLIAILRPPRNKIVRIPSIYGKDNFDYFMDLNIEKENLIYTDMAQAKKILQPSAIEFLNSRSQNITTKEFILKKKNP